MKLTPFILLLLLTGCVVRTVSESVIRPWFHWAETTKATTKGVQ